MTPEAARFLDKAERLLDQAVTMLRVELNDAAGRTGYLAGFHAAQAFIFERTGKILKTHRGVQTEFSRLTKDDPSFTAAQRIVLSQTYNLKAIADYQTGPGAEVSAEQAARAVENVRHFVGTIAAILASGPM
jgi:uncharacterized protein (UPF0332 family)